MSEEDWKARAQRAELLISHLHQELIFKYANPDFMRLVKDPHEIDIKIRKDGKDYWFEGDFLKNMFSLLEKVR